MAKNLTYLILLALLVTACAGDGSNGEPAIVEGPHPQPVAGTQPLVDLGWKSLTDQRAFINIQPNHCETSSLLVASDGFFMLGQNCNGLHRDPINGKIAPEELGNLNSRMQAVIAHRDQRECLPRVISLLQSSTEANFSAGGAVKIYAEAPTQICTQGGKDAVLAVRAYLELLAKKYAAPPQE